MQMSAFDEEEIKLDGPETAHADPVVRGSCEVAGDRFHIDYSFSSLREVDCGLQDLRAGGTHSAPDLVISVENPVRIGWLGFIFSIN